jgi:hypothetical protein
MSDLSMMKHLRRKLKAKRLSVIRRELSEDLIWLYLNELNLLIDLLERRVADEQR